MSEGERHPGDVIRVVVGVVVLALAALAVRDGRVGLTEANLFQAINTLPDFLEDPFRVVQVGAFAAAALSPVLALVARRWRLARDLVVTAVASWGAAELVERVVERGRPPGLLHGVELRGVPATGLGFPSSEVAVAAGLATAASPFLSRRGRRVAWGLVLVVAVARVYVGDHLPVDAIGGAALGWVVGALAHLAFGAPGGRPSAAVVGDALAGAGFTVDDLALAESGARGSAIFSGRGTGGQALVCRAVGRDERDVDLLDKAWQAVALRNGTEQPILTALGTVEHEGYLALLARRAGVRTPDVLATATFAGGAVLVEEAVDGRAGKPPGPPGGSTQSHLDGIWAQVALLRAARLAHGALCVANLVVDNRGDVWVVDWADARAGASERDMAKDIAELLGSLAVDVGAQRAVASAAGALGPGALVAALPLIQPGVLTRATRRAVRARKGLLDDVRAHAAAAAGVEEPALEPLTRIRPETLLVVALLALTVHILAPQIGELGRAWEAIRTANPGWLLVALAAALATFVAGAASQMGAVRAELALTRTTALQLAAAFASRLTPASIGTLALRIRFLQRSGLDREEAVTGTALNSVAGGIARLLAIAAAIPLVGGSGFSGVKLPDGWVILVVVVALGVVAGVIFLTALGRRLLAPARRALRELRVVLRDPTKATLLLGGALGVIILNIICFAASLAAVGAHVGLSTAIVVYLGGSTVGGAAPTPGGLGAVEAALMAGLTAARTDPSLAVAGVLSFRLLTYWLPIPLGYVALRTLRREALL